ncbi:AMP-binding protein [Aquabacterium sp.]|uniref:(2,3-dihydroxybenzoyl)adenylate synthase n=1 Tax=Aquabacterium sp. TaxID=1872578 RepID=UPI00248A5585|nr:AMP-binding protein [Aquabacterium sp.]MDI1261534.1 AMP-binding protein [Aquabacterium sp.]
MSLLTSTPQQADWTPWPADMAAHYKALGYWRGEPLWRLLADSALRHPGQTALVCGARRWSYLRLDEWARQLAGGLWQLGIQPGDHVVLQLPNVAEFLAACFALWRVGARPVMALPGHRHAEMAYFCAHTGATAAIVADTGPHGFDHVAMLGRIKAQTPSLKHVIVVQTHGGNRSERDDAISFASLAEHPPVPASHDHVDASTLALLQLSGGTTGLPKLIPRTHDDYAYSVRASADICQFSTDTVYLAVLPLAHNFPLSSPGTLGVLYAGGTVVLCQHGDPGTVFPLIAKEGVTHTAVVPPLAQAWLNAPESVRAQGRGLQWMQVGGARLSPDVAQRIVTEMGCRLQQVFGMAEGLVNYTRQDDAPETIISTQGRPISPDDELLVVDDHDVPVPNGVPGHLLARGPYTIRGYFRADEHNARAFSTDGFYRTGDVVRVLESGHIVVEGRAKDQINRGGEKIPAQEVETHLLAHPFVLDAALVAVPDQHLGERSCAVLVCPSDRPSRRALVSFLKDRGLSIYKYPDRYEFVDQLPKTNVGKIDKRALRQWLDNTPPTAP